MKFLWQRSTLATAVLSMTAVIGASISIAYAQQSQGCDPYVDHVEYTQSLQRRDNGIPLIDRRPVVLRFYMRVPDTCGPVPGYNALLLRN